MCFITKKNNEAKASARDNQKCLALYVVIWEDPAQKVSKWELQVHYLGHEYFISGC